MEKQFQTVFTANVDTATLKVKSLDGVDYLVGPVIMAKQIVMNGIYYPADELKASTTHWNGRPIVNGHPKDKDGNYISANSPDVLNEHGMGFIFNTSFRTVTTKLAAECWLNKAKVEANKVINDIISNGDMLEVSTGLFMTKEEKAGVYGNRDYNYVGRNFKPDHLAILPNDVGAMSVKDGAGFPRANIAEQLEANEISLFEKQHLIGKAVRKQFSTANSWAYLMDLFDEYAIFELWDDTDKGYALFKIGYTLGEDDQTVTFEDSPKKVICQKTYVDSLASNVLQPTSTVDANHKPQGEQHMNKQQKIKGWVDAKFIDANQASTLEKADEPTFALFAANMDQLEEQAQKIAANDEAAKKEAQPPKVETPAPAANAKDADTMAWMQKSYQSARKECIEKIMGNSANVFTKEELEEMSINKLEAISAIATNATDMAGAAGGSVPAKTPPAGPATNKAKVAPLVNKGHVAAQNQKK